MVLTYHELNPAPSPYLYSATVNQFEDHLRVVSQSRHGPDSIGHHAQITFDDGHVSNHQWALPLLEKHSVRATFFVIAGWMDARADFMTWRQLRELSSLGHRVQSHGWSHRYLTSCSESELREELERSRLILEDKVGAKVDALSAPHGRWNARVLEACAKAGYKRVYISDPWVRPRERHGVELVGRFMVRRNMTSQQLCRVLAGGGTWMFFMRAQYEAKEIAKFLLGDRIYHWLWGRLAHASRGDEGQRYGG